nr:23S rRNA (uracil(1939)-C(5))-methyltransferase RlmD [Lachnospiraceae bacterium]
MKRGEVCTGLVSKVSFPNRGIIKLESVVGRDLKEDEPGREVLVKGPLIPGQKVKFRIKKSRKENCTGILLQILEKSELETASEKEMCPHFGKCGGCTYLSMSYDNQLKLKEEQVREIFKDVVKVDFDQIFEGVVPSPDNFSYRNKMEYSFGDEYKGGPLALGLHKRNSFYDIVDVKGCKIVHEDFVKVISLVREYAKENNITFYNKITHEGVLRYLVVRRSETENELMVALVTSSQNSFDPLGVSKILRENCPNLTGFIHVITDSVSDSVSCDRMDVVYGRDYIYEKILGLRFKISLFSFFQTNTRGAEVLYGKAREYILSAIQNDSLKEKVLYDLYSGTGTIAQMLSPVAGKVIGVEIVEDAVKAARINADLNNISNCEFIAGDVLK